MKRALVIATLLAGACAGSAERPATSAPPVLSAAVRAQLSLRDRGDVAGMRRHAWNLLARVTREQDGTPIFEHFRTLAATFGDRAPGRVRPFRQMIAFDTGIPVLQASGAPMLTYVLFNEAAFRHIRDRGLYRRATLERINNGFRPDSPLASRQIAPFPRDAMSLKTVWAVVHVRGLTALSVWDGVGEQDAGGAPSLWPREVMVDPGGDAAADTPGARRVSLDRFYHVPIAADEIAAVRAIDPSARPGDHLVLLAMHVATAEIPDWIWTTYWWHDLPDAGPFAAGRPASLAGAWRNYLMDVAYSMDAPVEADGTLNIVFNPYLETFPAGHRSNCMTCHQGAVWTAAGAPSFLPVTSGARAATDPRFVSATRLDFMWSIATEAR